MTIAPAPDRGPDSAPVRAPDRAPDGAETGGFVFDNSYARDLPGSFLVQAPDVAPAPQLAVLNQALARDMGLDPAVLALHPGWFAGGDLPPGAAPIALAYAGHQFGGFSPQLGDGRAHLLGEFLGPDGQRWDLQLKGSGRTPFSRGGDGKAAIGPMLREYLISEAMAALGVPTTRSLAVALTGENVWRDSGALPGAVLTRVAASHIRVGSFQFFAARGEVEKLRALADYTIARHDPDLAGQDGRYLALFDRVVMRQARLIAQWMGLGFVHGVMNTDNMALSGETIDYGPCAFMEGYAPGTVFSSIDRQGRYAYANQPLILGWNLARLAESLLPLMGLDQQAAVDALNSRLSGIAAIYRTEWLAVMRAKLAIADKLDAGDAPLIDDLLVAMQGADWTLTFRHLATALAGDEAPLRGLFTDFTAMEAWLVRWRARLGKGATAEDLRAVNPVVIPRNHMVEAALEAASNGRMAPFHALLAQITDPFRDDGNRGAYALPAPTGFGDYVTFCGT